MIVIKAHATIVHYHSCLAEVIKISFILLVEQVVTVELIDNKKPLECHQRL